MKYLSKAYTYFSISGKQLDIQDFTDRFSITPTDTGQNRQGDFFLEYKIEAKDANEDLDLALSELMQAMILNSNQIRDYASQQDLYTKVFIVIQGNSQWNNGVFLSYNFIKFLNDLGASIEIEIYN